MGSNSRLHQFLKHFRPRFEKALETYLEEQICNLQTIDPAGQEIAQIVGMFTVGGGKRLRPALVTVGYQAAGGEDAERILGPAIAMELFHAYFLIHDDIMDCSDIRRGQPTVHRVFESRYDRFFKESAHGSGKHFAESMALLAGDLCCAMAYEAVTESDFPPARLILALNKMHAVANATVVGQVLDTITPLRGVVSEEAVLRIHRLKTARYTFEGPLQLGMLLAGAVEDKVEAISRYAIPVGIAFQIKDDLLGIFGSEIELEKSVTSDLEEGKETLLTVFARDHGSWTQRNRIAGLVGKRSISVNELEEAREILREIGAVTYCERMARELVAQGKDALLHLDLPQDAAIILAELADHVIGRTQ